METPIENGGLNKDDILDILETPDETEPIKLDEEKPKEEKPGEEDKEDEEVDELKEIEDELKEPTEDDLELMTPVRRKEILKEFPELFKKFPYLEKAYYREQKFTEIFPTIPDAESAKEKSEAFDNFESKVMTDGDIGIVLTAIKSENPEIFNKTVDKFLDSLKAADEPAYYHVLGNVIKSTIINMVEEAQNLGDEGGQPLKAAAAILNQFIFGTQTFTRPSRLAKEVKKEDDGKEKEINTREQELLKRQADAAQSSLQTKVDNRIRATIEGNIDPKGSMTDYVKKNAVRDAVDSLEELMGQDSRFATLMDKLWERAISDGFSEDSLGRISSTYITKAKTLLPTVIKRARAEALKGLGKKEETGQRKGPITPGRSTSHSPSGKETKEIPKGMKTVDFFMQD